MSSFINFEVNKGHNAPEFLYVRKSKRYVTATFRIWSVKDGEHIVSIIPSLALSSYGDTKQQSIEMLKEALNDYFETLVTLKSEALDSELRKHGWKHLDIFHKKQFTGPFIDKEGILRDFSLPQDTDIEEEVMTIS